MRLQQVSTYIELQEVFGDSLMNYRSDDEIRSQVKKLIADENKVLLQTKSKALQKVIRKNIERLYGLLQSMQVAA